MTIPLLTHRFVRLAIAAVAVALAATTTVRAQHGATYEVVSSFDIVFKNGSAPSSLRQDSDGTFYGTTSRGGLFDKGLLFRMDATGVVTPLQSFSDAEGAQPFALVRASDGRFYGLTSEGGSFGFGTVFRFMPGGTLAPVHSFSATDSLPVDLFAASDGNVYGLTAGGGDFRNGTIFVIDPDGTFTTIHSIPLSAGRYMASLIRGGDGRFYVTTRFGGNGIALGFGTVVTIDDAGAVTTLHNFTGSSTGDGQVPVGLMQSRDGNLYGTTRFGGRFSDGTVYSIDSTGNYRVLHSFNATVDGNKPGPDLLEASDGNLYGVTQGVPGDDFEHRQRGAGASRLFRIDSSGTVTPLHDVSDLSPGELIQGLDGRLYGPTAAGGSDGGGTIITRDVAGTLTTLYQFEKGEGPGRPNGVIQARDGRFYGTTSVPSSNPFQETTIGTVFAMDDTAARTTLHSFRMHLPSGLVDGLPLSNLLEGADGNLHGTTFRMSDGGLSPPGQVFKISLAGQFTHVASGFGMRSGVIQARDTKLYGTNFCDVWDVSLPTYSPGTVFRVEANGTRTVLWGLPSCDGPVAELVEIDDGSLYGATGGHPHGPFSPASGSIFRLNPAATEAFTGYRFPGVTRLSGRLIQGTDGLIYGTTVNGGTSGLGTVFSFTPPASVPMTLHHFSGSDGANPSAGVIQGLDGRLYGTTTNGGAFGYGTVFVMDVTGGLTTLHDFTLSDGANPVNELIQANDGAFYGAAPAGGPNHGGVIFRVRLATSPPDQYVELVSRNSGQCLDVSGASADAAAAVIQWPCHGGPNQQWRLEPAGGGAFRIIARHSGQALDVYGGFVDDVTPIIQWPVHGGDNQVWTLEPASDGYMRIVARHSGKALDVEFASADDGARVIQYTPHGGANQQWLLRPVE